MKLATLADALARALYHDRTGADEFKARLIWRDVDGRVIRLEFAEITDIYTASECAIVVDMTIVKETKDGQ